MKNKRLTVLLTATTAWLASVAATDEAPLTAADKRAVVEQLNQTLEANYVFPDKAKTIAATLRRHLVRDLGVARGQPPIHVFCRRTVERHVRVHSIDLGYTETYTRFEELRDYRDHFLKV